MAALYISFCLTFLFCLWELYDVATTNPGILQKGNISKEEYFNTNNTITIKGEVIEIKYCETCKIRRPPRSFHCGICDGCILVHGK